MTKTTMMVMRTTSAHAENTSATWCAEASTSNYLRARGEYDTTPEEKQAINELPPRTRRIQKDDILERLMKRTTSAHAENTASIFPRRLSNANYLRARGE